ncbi:LuxR family transcriptional regulator [Streptomyces incarnatus]|uniref:LuxR family transcriptional regulator n=1 Tax=Streptomyces incarnatus TaxID=665007 RepID=A0ABM5TLB2_9ACTN|nr:response regulator transcription factor [Streptomyces incarnatus]AKJ11864.1 LuxR family transcriptional regulator [Streptomyces incarnatus]
MTAPPHPEHGAEQLCPAGAELYARALREGHLSRAETEAAPCLAALGLLQPSVADLDRFEPVPAAVALQELLRTSAQRIADERRREARLAQAFEPLLRASADRAGTFGETSTIRIHSGLDRINEAIGNALSRAATEVLTVQPGGRRPVDQLAVALPREQAILARGCRMRTLYQHTSRHDPAVLAHYELLNGDVEVRTLDETPERLLVIDRTIAFMPASADRTLAAEIRHPPVVTYLSTVFDRLWRLATPMHPEAAQPPAPSGVTPRQRAIAALLVEGHTDAAIADRLGMNVRTARLHIAKLAAALGSDSRAQLGYLIGRSGILDQQGEVDR